MKLTPLGKIALLIIAIGIAFGGYRFWGQSNLGKQFGIKIPRPVFTLTPNSKTGGQTTGNGTSQNGNASGENDTASGGVEIPFVVTAAKKDWVTQEVAAFNAANVGKYHIKTIESPSREAMHAILAGKIKPVIWSPGSPIWPNRLDSAWKEKHPGRTIVDLNNPYGYRVFLRSPLVFMTSKDKAKFLRPLLGTPDCWKNLRELSLGKKKAWFSPLTFAHADPITSSSGILTLGLILYDYGQRTGNGGNLTALAKSSGFLNYLAEVERGLVYDAPAEKGTTALTKAFLKAPNLNQYDLITGYESAALAAAKDHPNLAVIYPNPTVVSEHAVSLLSEDWVTPQQREGAEAFIQFMGTPESLRAGVATHFRPVQENGDISLNPELTKYKAQGFEQSFARIDSPPYESLNTVASQWKQRVVK